MQKTVFIYLIFIEKSATILYNIGMEKEHKRIWDALLSEVQDKISTVAYDMWFSKATPLTVHDNRLIMVVPMHNIQAVLQNDYRNTIQWGLKQLDTYIKDVIFILPEDKSAYEEVMEKPAPQEVARVNPFDPKFTFDNFVVGPSNQIAVAAAKAVASNPGRQFNPLFIYGGVGLGKTHIMHAIGNQILNDNPQANILYVTTEQFVNDFIDSIRNNKNNEENKKFREKYRSADVLMLDDIQFIAGKTTSQEELFHTFNNLYQSKKQIVISSDRHPRELTFLEERLQSRFQSGLTCDITPPDLETRIAILQKKAFNKNVNISQSALYFIAEHIDSNIRELEGALSKVIFYCSLTGSSADSIDTVKEALKDDIDISTHILSIDSIVEAVCAYYNITKAEIVGKRKTKQIAFARQIAFYLIFDLLGMPLDTIGKYFGGKDHTTVMYAKNKIIQLEQTDHMVAAQIKDIKNMIQKR